MDLKGKINLYEPPLQRAYERHGGTSRLSWRARSRYCDALAAFATIILWQLAMLHAQTTQGQQDNAPRTGKELYQAACSACHGPDGKGTPQTQVGFDTPLPDFTDCQFASREPDPDWVTVVHQGGPVRGFSELMPAFGEALTVEEIQSIVSLVRGFCRETAWPRGELNLPRPLITEKAFPEDEAVLTTTVATEGPATVINDLLYERRFGARNQIEVKLPVGVLSLPNGGSRGGVGDITLGYKRALFHSLDSGSIFSAGGEATLPTGNKDYGLGKGFTTVEAFAAFGQILPSDGFLHFQGGIEAPTDSSRAAKETFWRTVAGRTFAQEHGFGRSWSPMLEVLGSHEHESDGQTQWDLVPQIQVSLNSRQHILFSVGVRIPMTHASQRSTQVMFYLLWDWFDGGFRDGW